MENKELIAYRNTKPHLNKETLSELVGELNTPKEIAKRLHISQKLVKIKLKEFSL
jgi:DNA-binding CsgD family transcriptional regulator